MDLVFKVLADPTRRELLDELFRCDGQTLVSLASRFELTRSPWRSILACWRRPVWSRTRRRGREKLHFLNPVPIHLIHDRWVSKYTEAWAAGLVELKRDLEEVDPPRRLVQWVRALWDDNVASEGTSRITWEIEQVGDSCRLTVVHDQLRQDADAHRYGGWSMILSGLKTWLETGQELTSPGSLSYGESAPASTTIRR